MKKTAFLFPGQGCQKQGMLDETKVIYKFIDYGH